jgi:tartrate-resistant acid phosphatase type 5
MGRKAEAMCSEGGCPDFVVSTGDNFYESGLVSVDDPRFAASFTNVYTHPRLQVGHACD